MYAAILFMWIFIPAYVTTVGCVGTDIVHGTCVPWGVYSSYSVQISVMSSVFLTTYLLPLMLMTFCYIRIVYALRYKVSYGSCEEGKQLHLGLMIILKVDEITRIRTLEGKAI